VALPTYVGEGAVAGGQAAVSPAWPTTPAHQADDIGILMVETANETVSLSTPAGFTSLPAPNPQGTGTAAGLTATRLHLFWKRATSASEATPTVADSGNHNCAKIVVFRGCILTGDPWDIIAGDTGASSTSVAVPGGTTTVIDCLIAAFFTTANDGTNAFAGGTNADLANVAERVDSGTTQGNGGSIGLITGEKATAGTFGTTTTTVAAAAVQARIMVALKPPAATVFDQAVGGTLSHSGSLAKQATKVLAGALSNSGALVGTKLVVKLLDGTLSHAGELVRQASKVLAGTLSHAGELVRSTNRALAGALSQSGALATARVIVHAVSGSLAQSGELVRTAVKALAGSLSGAGTIAKQAVKLLAGTLAHSGALATARTIFKALAGTLTSSSALSSTHEPGVGGATESGRLTDSTRATRNTIIS
jgi:hypothetical protein